VYLCVDTYIVYIVYYHYTYISPYQNKVKDIILFIYKSIYISIYLYMISKTQNIFSFYYCYKYNLIRLLNTPRQHKLYLFMYVSVFMCCYLSIELSKVIMQGKLFQRCTYLFCCTVLYLGGNVNTRQMSQPDMGSIFRIKNQ